MMPLPQGPSFRLDGRSALVTGGSGGIGLAAAAALGRAGAHVTVAARREAELVAVCEALRAEAIDCEWRVLDVTDSAAVDRELGQGRVFDILVNNAGMNRPQLMVDQPEPDFDAVFDLNVKASFTVSRAVARRLLAEQRSGSLINVSSQMGHVGSPRRTLYCASKHAIEGFTKALAWELGPSGIRVNTICPTFIETPMTAPMLAQPGFHDWVCARNALGRVGQLHEVMGAVVFLAGDASSLVTGSALMLDAGWTAA